MGAGISVRRAARIVISLVVVAASGCSVSSFRSIWTDSPASGASPPVTPPVPKTWHLVGTAGFTPSNVAYTSIAINPTTKMPYLAFEDGAYGAYGSVVSFSGGTWSYLPPAWPGFTSRTAESTKIAFATDGTVYFAYAYPSSPDDFANVMSYTPATNWQQVGLTDLDFDTIQKGHGIALAVDKTNMPVVAYVDTTARVKVQRWDGSAWGQVGTQSLFNAGASNMSIAIDSLNHPWVAYEDGGAGNWATVMRFDGSSWNLVGPIVGSASTGSVQSTSLVLNSSDQPYLACWDEAYGTFGLANVKTLSGGVWVNVGNAGFSANSPYGLSLAIGAGGVLYAGYQDGNPGYMTVMTLSGTTWVAVGSPGFSPVQVQYPALALDAAGTPYVVFCDAATLRPDVMAYY